MITLAIKNVFDNATRITRIYMLSCWQTKQDAFGDR